MFRFLAQSAMTIEDPLNLGNESKITIRNECGSLLGDHLPSDLVWGALDRGGLQFS